MITAAPAKCRRSSSAPCAAWRRQYRSCGNRGWLDAKGETHEHHRDVAVQHRQIDFGQSRTPVGNTVNVAAAATQSRSAPDAVRLLEGSGFNPASAFYYVRVIEISPRWTVYDAGSSAPHRLRTARHRPGSRVLADHMRSTMKRVLKEPLLHFLLGVTIFATHGACPRSRRRARTHRGDAVKWNPGVRSSHWQQPPQQ